VVTILEAMMVTITDNVSVLGDLDAIAGDGDHGIGMTRGIQAAHLACIDAYQQGAGAGAVLQSAADAWADVAGGTSGAIWGIILNTVGTTLGNDNKPDGHCIALAISRASEAVMHFGKARPGDKTLVDTLQPFSDALHRGVNNGLSLPDAWHAATLVALDSAEQTAQLIPKVGRARPLAERSRGTPDPGAISLAMIIQTVDKYWRA
jgi:dihydroxyacetone kinase